MAADVGIVLPKVRIRDNVRINEFTYRIKISSNIVASGVVYPDRLLAMDSGATTGRLPGEEVRDPAFQRVAYWIGKGAQPSDTVKRLFKNAGITPGAK